MLVRLRSARGGAEHCACQRLLVPCDGVVKQRVVRWTWVTSLCADEMTGVSPDQHIRKQGVQGAAGSVRTHNERQGTRGPVRSEVPEKGRGSSALLASETAVGQKSGESDNEDLPSSASGEETTPSTPSFGASVHHTGRRRQQRNREGNS